MGLGDPAATINVLGKRALGGDADAVRDLTTTYTNLLNTDEAVAATVAKRGRPAATPRPKC